MTDGETGYLSDVGDTDKMAEDTFELLQNEGLRRAFGQKGRENAVQRYGSDKIIPLYIAFYEKVLGKARMDHPLPALTAGGGNSD